jgi:hypothetical protein
MSLILDSRMGNKQRRLWAYEVLVGLAFFDPSVSEEEKSKMVYNMSEQERSANPPHRLDYK